MKPKETIDTGQQDLFHSRLDRIIDLKNGMVVVAGLIDWDVLVEACGGAHSEKPGHPALPTRLLAGLHMLKFKPGVFLLSGMPKRRSSRSTKLFCVQRRPPNKRTS